MMLYRDRAKNKFYMFASYNWPMRCGLKIVAFDMGSTKWSCIGESELLEEYLNG
jgi:hypothetical protein